MPGPQICVQSFDGCIPRCFSPQTQCSPNSAFPALSILLAALSHASPVCTRNLYACAYILGASSFRHGCCVLAAEEPPRITRT